MIAVLHWNFFSLSFLSCLVSEVGEGCQGRAKRVHRSERSEPRPLTALGSPPSYNRVWKEREKFIKQKNKNPWGKISPKGFYHSTTIKKCHNACNYSKSCMHCDIIKREKKERKIPFWIHRIHQNRFFIRGVIKYRVRLKIISWGILCIFFSVWHGMTGKWCHAMSFLTAMIVEQ